MDRSDPGPAAACPTAAPASAPRSAAPRRPATPRPAPPTQSPPAAATASPQLARLPPPPLPPRPARSRTPRARLPAPLPDGAAPGGSRGGAGSAARDRALDPAPALGGSTGERGRYRRAFRLRAREGVVGQWRGQPARGVLGQADCPQGRVRRLVHRSLRLGPGALKEVVQALAGFRASPWDLGGGCAGGSRQAGFQSRWNHKRTALVSLLR